MSVIHRPRLRVRRVTPLELDTCLELRRVVFVLGQGVPMDEEVDGRDPLATHFLAEWQRDAGRDSDEGWMPVGTARSRVVASDGHDGPSTDPLCKAERVAVLAEFRGLGVGRALMGAIETDARRHGLHTVKLGSQENAVGFYLRLGYQRYGDRFMDAGIPHYWMAKQLVPVEP